MSINKERLLEELNILDMDRISAKMKYEANSTEGNMIEFGNAIGQVYGFIHALVLMGLYPCKDENNHYIFDK